MPDRPFNAGRLQEVRPGEYAPEVYTLNQIAAAAGMSRLFLASTDKLTSGAATNARFLVRNPAESTRMVHIVRMSLFGAGGIGWVTAYYNPTAGLPTTPLIVNNNVAGVAPDNQCVVTGDLNAITALAGGDKLATFGIDNGRRVEIELAIALPPGTSAGVNIVYGLAVDFSGAAYITEE